MYLDYWFVCMYVYFLVLFLKDRERTCEIWWVGKVGGSGRSWGEGKSLIRIYCMKKLFPN